jgi:hypothetical protein
MENKPSFQIKKQSKYHKQTAQSHWISTEGKFAQNQIPLIRSPIKLWTGRSSPRPPGAFSNSLQSTDLAHPGIPGDRNSKAYNKVNPHYERIKKQSQ